MTEYDIEDEQLREALAALKTRHLDIGESPRLLAVIHVRATMFRSIREFFYAEGWTEVTVPTIATLTGSCEDYSTLFGLPYFDNEAFLIQTGQLHLETMLRGIGKAYSINRSYRAERRTSRRHLTEFVLVEAEAAHFSMPQLLDTQERLIQRVCLDVARMNEAELEILGANRGKLVGMSLPFERITYTEALEMLGIKEWGRDLSGKEEIALTQQFGAPVFVTHHPKKIKFFNMREPDNANDMVDSDSGRKVVLSSDLLLPGHGEVIGGSEREPDPDKLWSNLMSSEQLKRMQEDHNVNPADYRWYLDLCKKAHLPHGGFGLGFERLVRWICDLDTIFESVEYPRSRAHLTP